MHPVMVIREQLQDHMKDDLIEWVQEQYGPPVSYTYVFLANRFKLLVDGAGKCKTLY